MSIKREYNFDGVGEKDMYLLHHEEIESLNVNIPEAKRIRFFMTFGQSYLDHMRCLEDVGMLSTSPVMFEGKEIVPIKFLKALLPDPATLGERTVGKTNIGCIFTGKKDGQEKSYYIYNICDHQECYKEVGSQAVSYTTGVPAMCGALMLLEKKWNKAGVYTVEEFDPDPFIAALDQYDGRRCIRRAFIGRNGSFTKYPDRIAGHWRLSFHWGSSGFGGKGVLYCTDRDSDHSSGTNEWDCDRRTADL